MWKSLLHVSVTHLWKSLLHVSVTHLWKSLILVGITYKCHTSVEESTTYTCHISVEESTSRRYCLNYIDIRACILVWFKWLECTTTVPPVGPFVEYNVHIYDDNWLSIYSHYVMAQAVRMSVRSSVRTSFRPSVSKLLRTQHLTTVFSGWSWNLLAMHLFQVFAYAYIANSVVL